MERRVTSAEELEKLSPGGRDRIVRAGFSRDLKDAPDDLVRRARAFVESHIAQTESAPTAKP